MHDTPPPAAEPEPAGDDEDTSLAARLRKAEQAEAAADAPEEDSSLAARLERAERERNGESDPEAGSSPSMADMDMVDEEGVLVRSADGRSFYDRHSAKLPRLEGDGGRSVLSAIGDMRPESEPKGRKGRRRKGK